MAVTVERDIIQDTGAFVSDAGIVSVEAYLIRGLTPGPSIMQDALTTPGIPTFAAPHSSIANAFAFSVEPFPMGNARDKVRVVVRYRDISVVWCRIVGNVERETTKRDRDGKMLTVRYVPGGGQAKPFSFSGKNPETQVVEMSILRPGMTLQFERWGTENIGSFLASENAAGNIYRLRGTTNRVAWQGLPPDCWMCTDANCEGTYIPGKPIFWHLSISFSVRCIYASSAGTMTNSEPIETWRQVSLYVHPKYRKTPAEVDILAGGYPTIKEGNGWKENETFNGNRDFQAILPWIPQLLPNDIGQTTAAL
jgi:hypothetical protein